MGIGIPVDLELESVTIGYVLKAIYYMPENASNYLNFLSDPFDLTTRPITGFFVRKRRDSDEPIVLEEPAPTDRPASLKESSGYDDETQQKYEKYQVQPVEVDAGSDAELEAEPDENSLSEADYWNQEDKAEWLEDTIRPKSPPNLGASRLTLYKSIATLAER